MMRGGSHPSASQGRAEVEARIAVAAVVEPLGARLSHSRQVGLEIAWVWLELDLAGDGHARA